MAPLIDKTVLFRDILKETQVKSDFKPDKSRILQRKEKDPLEVKAHVIIEHTTKLKEFLHENRNAYIDILNREFSAYAMTDIERDRIDAGANNLIRTINGLVEEFKKDLRTKMSKLRGCSRHSEGRRTNREKLINKIGCKYLFTPVFFLFVTIFTHAIEY